MKNISFKTSSVKQSPLLTYKKTMKTIRYIIILMIFSSMVGCEPDPTQLEIVNGMKCPVILIAESPKTASHYGKILLIDGDNEMSTMGTGKSFARIIAETYDVGDTIKKCRGDIQTVSSNKFVE